MSYMHVSRSRNEYPSPSRRDSDHNFKYSEAQRHAGPASGNNPDSNFGNGEVQKSSDLTYLLNQKRHELDNLNSKMQVTDPKFYNMVKQYEKELGAFQRSRVEESSPVRYQTSNPHVNEKENEKLRRLQWIEQERLKRQNSGASNYNERESYSSVGHPEQRQRPEDNAPIRKSRIEERYNEEMGYRNSHPHYDEYPTPQSHKKGPLITRDMEKVIGSVELYGDNMKNFRGQNREVAQSSEGGLFDKMGKYYKDNEAEKKRRYREELDQMRKQKPNNDQRRQDIQKQIDFNKENRPSNAQDSEYKELTWEQKNRMADEVMKSLLQKERGNNQFAPPPKMQQSQSYHHQNSQMQQSQSHYHQNPQMQRSQSHQMQYAQHGQIPNQSEIYSIPASTPRRTPEKRQEYDHSPQRSRSPNQKYENRIRDMGYGDYERRDRESVDRSVEFDKKKKYKQELDAQMEERKRVQSAKPGAREEAPRTSVSESQDRRPTTSTSNTSQFSLFKAQEEAANRQKQKNLEMQKYAEELKKQMQENEERKKAEKRRAVEEDAREELKAQKLVQQAIEKNNDMQYSNQANLNPQHSSPYGSPAKNQGGQKSRSHSPLRNDHRDHIENESRPVDNLQTAQFPNPYEQQKQQPQQPYPNMPHPYGNPMMGNYFNPLQPYGNYGGPMPGYPMYPPPGYWMPGPMYGMPQYPDMNAYRNHMMQIMEERVKMERLAMQEKFMYQNQNYNSKGNEDLNISNYGAGKSPVRDRSLHHSPSPVKKPSDNLHITDIMNVPFANSHLYASQMHAANDLQNSVLHGIMGTSQQSIEPDSLNQSYANPLNRSLPSTNLNFEIPPQQLEQSFNKDLNLFKVLHQKAFQLTPEKSGNDLFPAPKSQSNASPMNEKSQAPEESKDQVLERETVMSIIPPSERGTANPSVGGINHYSTLLQYSQSIDNPLGERTTVKTNVEATASQKPRIESGLFYTVDNMGVMITPHQNQLGTFGKIDATPQVIYKLSPSLATEGDYHQKLVSSSKKDQSEIQEEDKNLEISTRGLREQTGRFGPSHHGDRLIKPLVHLKKEPETARSDSEKSFENHSKAPVEAVEQKLEMKLGEMDEVRSLMVAEDDESAYYDEAVMKEFAESHDKMLEEIRMDLRKNIKSENAKYEKVAAVAESHEGTEQELLDIVREAKKAVGIVEKAVIKPDNKRPVSPAARQNFRQNQSPLKLEKSVSVPEREKKSVDMSSISGISGISDDISPSKRQKVGGIVEKAVAMPDKKRPLSPVSIKAIKESQSPMKPPINQVNKKSPLKVETEFEDKGKNLETFSQQVAMMTTPKSADPFKLTNKRYRSPKTIDPFARAAASLASVKSAPLEDKPIIESKSQQQIGKESLSIEERFNSQKSATKREEKEQSIDEEISATAIEEEEKVFEEYDKELKSQEIHSSNRLGKDEWDILDILQDNQDKETIPSITTDKNTHPNEEKKMELSEIGEAVDQKEIETDGDRSRSMISIGKPKSPNTKRDRSRGIENELKEIEERLNRGRPKTSQTEKSLTENNSRIERFGRSKNNFQDRTKSPVQDKSQEVVEIPTSNWEDLRPEMMVKSKVTIEEKSEGRVANEKRSKDILNKLERLLDGWAGEDSEKENNQDYSLESGEKIVTSSQPIFKNISSSTAGRRSLSKRYSDGDNY